MASTTSSRKAKGRKLQDTLRDKLIENFPLLEDGDIKCAIMGCSGMDILLSPSARKQIPYAFECKNTEKINIWDALEQAEKNSGTLTPVLVFKRNRTKAYACIDVEKFIELIEINYTGRKSSL